MFPAEIRPILLLTNPTLSKFPERAFPERRDVFAKRGLARSGAFPKESLTLLRKFQLLTILCAWLAATGSQWDVIQVAGWGKMFAAYVRTMPALRAAQLTLTGEMCSICETVTEAKQEQAKALPGGRDLAKIVLLFQPAERPVFDAGLAKFEFPGDAFPRSAQRAAPPLPPPRLAVA